MNIGSEAFKGAFVAHRNAVTTTVKRTLKTTDCDGREKEEKLKEDLVGNVEFCLHNSFCRNEETNVEPLLCCKQKVEEQRCWSRSDVNYL